jgi:hypothetical protein
MIRVRDTRTCEQCGSLFTPRREHARFCSSSCRIAWNREHQWDLKAEASALDWSVSAMVDVTERLSGVRAAHLSSAFAAVSEAVWWVTIVDATLVRYHVDAYECVMAAQPGPERRLIEGTFGGLRFVRNQMGYHVDYQDFIGPGPGDHVTCWVWRPLPEPVLAGLPPRGQAWEMTRYHAYQSNLAGRTIGETFTRAAGFLRLVSARATSALAAS